MVFLAIEWASVGVKVLQFILSFSILVVLHELGHFLPARWFKCRVEKFYLFFNPGFSLFKKKIGDTEYGVGWIPFGGYVKISGMIDESMDKEQMALPPQPYEFRSKPAWQRLIIMLGGVTVNVLLAFAIFIMVMWVWGENYIPVANLKYGLYADSLGRRMGMQDGDNIIAVAGKPLERQGSAGSEMIMNEAKTVTVTRNGQTLDLTVPVGIIGQLNKNRLGGLSIIRFPEVIDSVMPWAKITSGDLRRGDTLIAMNGHRIQFASDQIKDTGFQHMRQIMSNHLVVVRNGHDTVNVVMERNLAKDSALGIRYMAADSILGNKHISYTFFQAVPAGVHKAIETLSNYIRNLKLLFTSKEVKAQDSLGSVISIAGIFPSIWDWQSFWMLTGIFSILLAFMNVLPIPALDGGHALFTLVEMISGRKPSDKFIEYAQMVGMILLFSLMAYALGLDIFHVFGHK
ncbi:RIP metalloprotease RseP [Puia sp.]|uniref:RIP metalloprotease RseP n=1 Tax=Puia sp. TaxID=2045100 RepID=UPI002F404DD5